ncbi:hypothetical protein K1X12_00345 [Hyphomonas sp. WL0036]|uniref:hypothetical protein n=1 Tax=Hyphomonas sediminis TaxID=2866160 RepID=UPI001C803EA3|nr:hypothetical protein [Hyphomonas sediminis]MBY9065324.1 hypothetical protein [Hyphomonas sediminis]
MPLGRLIAAVLLGALIAGFAFAEPGTPPGDEIKAEKLDYKDRPDKDGRMAATEVTVGETPVRLYVRGTNVSAPFSVQVIAAAKARPLEVTLHRQNWGKAVQTGDTGRDGTFAFEGRAYGDVGVQLTSPDGQPARATVVFWEGTPALPSLATVYTNTAMQGGGTASPNSAGGASAPATGGTPIIMYVIAGLLAVIVVFLGLMVMRRGKGGAAALLIIGGLTMAAVHEPAPAMAQGETGPPDGGINPFTGDGITRPGTPPAEPKPGEVANPFDVDKPPPEVPGDKDKDATAGKPDETPKDNPFAGEGTTTAGGPVELKPEDFDPSNAPKDDADAPVDADYAERLDAAEQRIADLNRQASANRAEIEQLRMLVESDRKNEPDPSNLPPLPLSCRPPAIDRSEADAAVEAGWENFEACKACFSAPLTELDELMLNYERLRIILMSTAEFVNTAITMGDTVPKPHQFVEMSWAKEKAGIQKSFQGTKDAYDAKRAEFNDKLSGILDELGKCEADLNNNPMWRSTDGQLFYQTMKASYQRAN